MSNHFPKLDEFVLIIPTLNKANAVIAFHSKFSKVRICKIVVVRKQFFTCEIDEENGDYCFDNSLNSLSHWYHLNPALKYLWNKYGL